MVVVGAVGERAEVVTDEVFPIFSKIIFGSMQIRNVVCSKILFRLLFVSPVFHEFYCQRMASVRKSVF